MSARRRGQRGAQPNDDDGSVVGNPDDRNSGRTRRVPRRRASPPSRQERLALVFAIQPLRFLSFYSAVLFVIPAYLTFPGLGGAGSPATMLGLIALTWWTIFAIVLVEAGPNSRNIVRTALTLRWFTGLFWTHGKLRVPHPARGRTIGPRAGIVIAGLAGTALLAMDGLRNREEVERLARVIMLSARLHGSGRSRSVCASHQSGSLDQNSRPCDENVDVDTTVGARSIFTRRRALPFTQLSLASSPRSGTSCLLGAPDAADAEVDTPPLCLCFVAMISLSRSAVFAIAVAAVVLLIECLGRAIAEPLGLRSRVRRGRAASSSTA